MSDEELLKASQEDYNLAISAQSLELANMFLTRSLAASQLVIARNSAVRIEESQDPPVIVSRLTDPRNNSAPL